MIGPLPTLPAALAAANPEDPTKIRVGRVVRYDSATVTIDISGTVINASAVYLRSYMPVLGDYCVVVWQGGSLLVLGAVAGTPADNTVANASFELDTPAVATPTGWGLWTVAGTNSVETKTVADGYTVDGPQAAYTKVTSAGGTVNLYSSPIPVDAGQVWSASALVHAEPVAGDTLTATLSIAWHAQSTDVPPTYVSLDTTAAQTFTARTQAWVQLRGGGTAGGDSPPATARFARVVLSTATGAANSAAWWDRVTLRQIS
jgi:hypothetical protein